jgi:hypothetical protein
LMDVLKLHSLSWKASITLDKGIRKICEGLGMGKIFC